MLGTSMKIYFDDQWAPQLIRTSEFESRKITEHNVSSRSSTGWVVRVHWEVGMLAPRLTFNAVCPVDRLGRPSSLVGRSRTLKIINRHLASRVLNWNLLCVQSTSWPGRTTAHNEIMYKMDVPVLNENSLTLFNLTHDLHNYHRTSNKRRML